MLVLRRSYVRLFSTNVYKPTKNVRLREKFKELLTQNPNRLDWNDIRTKLLTYERFLELSNIDAIVIRMCSKENRLDVAKSYIQYLKSKSIDVNSATAGYFLRLFYNSNENEKSITNDEIDDVKNLINSLMQKHEIMDSTLAENTILGLTLTDEWMKSLELLEQMKIISTPGPFVYSSIIKEAFEENCDDVAWRLLNQMSEKEIPPNASVFVKYFSKYISERSSMEKMLNFISANGYIFNATYIEEFCKVFNQEKKHKIVRIYDNGLCPACNKKLPSIKLNKEEFDKLSKTFLDDVLIRKDVFLKTNPEEIERFKHFVEKNLAFDCVIDGLNVAYSHGNQQPPIQFARNIAAVVKYFVEKNQSCLVIGRKYMARWDVKTLDYIKKNSSLFLADDLSQDDPFILYSALKSGPKTNIFSRDLMRSHSYLLDVESKKLFRKWQQQHQYSLVTTLRNLKIIVKEPIDFDISTQKVGSHWHIPFTNEKLFYSYEMFDLPSKWICLKI